jgi:hypothetical protein
MTNSERQLESYFSKYEPAMVKLGKALRAKLRARLPGLFEIGQRVYQHRSGAPSMVGELWDPPFPIYGGGPTGRAWPKEALGGFAKGVLSPGRRPDLLRQ